MEPAALISLAVILAPYFHEAGKTIAVETAKLTLEKRQDIAKSFVSLFKPDEIITLGLDKPHTPEEIKALQEANPEVVESVHKKITSHSELLDELSKAISRQEGRTINAKYYIEHIDTAHFN